jgi:FtsH-binding integral membrane protein
MLNFLYYAHSGLRWILVLAVLAALGFMIFSLVTKREQDRATRIIMVTFSSLVGVQWVLGMLYYVVIGSNFGEWNLRNQATHAAVMTGALVVAHLYLPFRKRASNQIYYAASVGIVIVTTVFLVWGVATLLPGGGLFPADRWSFAPNYTLGGG